jgi:hypothetical protein
MLTKQEIQAVITKINVLMALDQVEECVRSFDLQKLQFALLSRHLGLKSVVKAAKLEQYCRKLADILARSPDAFLTTAYVEKCISKVNKQVCYILRCRISSPNTDRLKKCFKT